MPEQRPGLRLFGQMPARQRKTPAVSPLWWDYCKQLTVLPGDKAFFTSKESGCLLTR